MKKIPVILSWAALVGSSFLNPANAAPAPDAGELGIHSVEVNGIHPVDGNGGDTWAPAWTSNGDIYSPSNDTNGFNNAGNSNIMFNRITGDPLKSLSGETVNQMTDYGKGAENGPDGCSWKSSGCAAVDGALYWLVARHKYGDDSGDPKKRQPAHGASIIKSTDNGRTWTRSVKENYEKPMFPGSRFATPYFINYGQDGHEMTADGSDKYVYALSNNGFWDNGDDMVLGRVLRSKIGNLSGTDWQYFKQGDGATEAAWSSEMKDAAPVLSNPDHLGMTGAVYMPKQKCYLMVGWYYPAGGGKIPGANKYTIWDFYAAAHPWGPWKNVGSQGFMPMGFYCPEICSKFTSADGAAAWVFTAGNWNEWTVYRLNAVSLTIK